MKISSNLLHCMHMNPTKETRQQTIESLCQSIDNGILTLPLYQRDLSWTLQKCVDLLNYQLTGKAPVSAISINLINNTEIAVPQVGFLTREIVELKSGLNSVVDGQQRMSTNYKAHIGSKDFEDIVLDLIRGVFILKDKGDITKKHQVPVGVLLHKDGNVLTEYIKNNRALGNFDAQSVLLQVRSKIKNYNYTINQANDLTEEEQIEWFEVLNNAGSRVSAIQMRLAKLKGLGIDIYTDYTHVYVEKIKDHGYDEVFLAQTTNVSYPISALSPAYEVIMGQPHSNNYCPIAPDCRENAICSMTLEQIKKAFNITLDALDKTLDFIDDHGLKKPSRIDYINYLVGFFVFNANELNVEDEEYLVNWYKNTDFKNSSNTKRRIIYSNLLARI